MIPLPSSFRLRGFDWRILQREGDIAIIEQNKAGWTNPALNVVIVQKHKARKLPNGEMTIDAEGLPSWEQWGQQAWTCGDMADAKRRFNNLADAANGPRTQYVSRFTGSEDEKALSTCGGFVGPQTPQQQPIGPLAQSDTEIGDSRRDG